MSVSSNGAEPWRTAYAHPGSWVADFPPLSMPALFETAVSRFGERPLADFLGRKYTYRQLHAEALGFAAWLQERGVAKGDRVELRGFGAFSVKNRPARTGRNPRTGEHVSVEKKSVPFFKTGKEMRERLNKD